MKTLIWWVKNLVSVKTLALILILSLTLASNHMDY